MKTKKPKLPKLELKLVREPREGYNVPSIQQPEDIVQYLEYMQHSDVEVFVVVLLNANNEPLGVHEVSRGTISASLVHPREVFKAAILLNAFAMICAHNHPSGAKLKPSLEDIDTTKTLIAAGNLLGVPVIDHLILGNNDSYSIREYHSHLWSE